MFTLTGEPPSVVAFAFFTTLSSQNLSSSSTTGFGPNPVVDWYIFADERFPPRALDDGLPACTGLRSLVLSNADPLMFWHLEHTRLRRLSAPIASFFGRYGSINLALPMVSSLTHLDVFNASSPGSWNSWTTLALLPMLTHLGFFQLSNAAADKILVI
jgi:hypothetical protein